MHFLRVYILRLTYFAWSKPVLYCIFIGVKKGIPFGMPHLVGPPSHSYE